VESASVPQSGARAERKKKEAASNQGGKEGLFHEFGELFVFSLRAFRALPGSLRYASEIMRLNAIITRRTTLLMFVMAGFLGISLTNFGFFFLRSIGAGDFAGIVPGLTDTRMVGPQMFAYVFAGSVCCAIAAELGSARIQQEIDAYEVEGVDPMEILIGTRVLAVLLYVPLATFVCIAGIFGGGYTIVVLVLHGNNGAQFTNAFFSIFPMKGIFTMLVTVAILCLQCVLVACYYGMRNTGGGPDAVGNAVARSLAINLVLLHFVLAICSLFFYGGALAVPIGD
jgi:phospholipid/cholesterol/gamma-HCH transport system permease protein